MLGALIVAFEYPFILLSSAGKASKPITLALGYVCAISKVQKPAPQAESSIVMLLSVGTGT